MNHARRHFHGHHFAVGGEGEALDAVVVALGLAELPAGGGVPEADGRVLAAGGEHLTLGDAEGAEQSIQTLTPTSPLGRALLGLGVGDEAEVESPQGPRFYEIIDLA